MNESQEAQELAANVAVSFGEITEDDLGLRSEDIQQLVVAPTDWTIGVLIDLLKRRKIDLQPNYQRRIAWGEERMSRFIESLFMRLPVPQIVLAELKPGVFAVIDGKQRMNSLARFCLDQENRQLYTLLSSVIGVSGLHKERSHEPQYHQPYLSRRSQGAGPSGSLALA